MTDICVFIPGPDYFEDWNPHCKKLEQALGFKPAYRHWTETGDLSNYKLILPLIAWGYQRETSRWFALLDRMETDNLPVCNPVSVLRWNSDKAYLVELAEAGINVVPTIMTSQLDQETLSQAAAEFGTDLLIIKPPISGGADGTYKINASDNIPAMVLGQRMMIQPFLPAISGEGEFSLFYFGGHYSHAIIKRPAKGDFRVQDYFGGTETAINPPADTLELATAALHAAPDKTLYARVDMVRDAEGIIRLMELELIEPSLFLHFADDKGAAFAAAVQNAIQSVR